MPKRSHFTPHTNRCPNVFALRRFWLLLCFPAAAALLFAAAQNQGFAEWYAVTVYPVFSRCGSFLSSLLPFSIAEILVVLALPALLFYFIWYIVKLIRQPQRRAQTAVRFAGNFLCILSVFFLLFTVNCGVNYYRRTFAETCGLPVQASSRQELEGLCRELAQKANDLREKTEETENGVMSWSFSGVNDAAEQAQAAFDTLNKEYPLLLSGYGKPKSVLLSRGMSYCNITGIFFPFTMEANVNTDVPEYTIPATMCHELSHLRGFMREDEANFIGYLACENSSSADFRYSGTMLAFVYANNALYSVDGETASEIYGTLSSAVQRDLAANSDYWKQFEGPVAQAADSVNNAYLKANNQQDGVKSYGRMVDLLLAEYRKTHAG